MAVPAVQNLQAVLGRGKIGPVTAEHVKACNDWIRPLVERDCLEQSGILGASDIATMLELGRRNNALFRGNIGSADTGRNLLLLDIGQAVTQIRWGNGPWEDDVISSPDMRCRLTRRGRMMLQKCCRDLWDQMLYGKPE